MAKRKQADPGDELTSFLLSDFRKERNPAVKRRLALELMPFYRPKLKGVDMTATTDMNIRINIGGGD